LLLFVFIFCQKYDILKCMGLEEAERRQIENEMIFRRVNEAVIQNLVDLDAEHTKNNELDLMWDQTILLEFQCECSDEKCNIRIPLTLKDYQEIHTDRNTFIVKPNHQVDPIEKVIQVEDTYSIVKKNHSTAEPGDKLNKTNLDNSKK
jgi:hypothetical protein